MRLTELEPEWIIGYNAATHGLKRRADVHQTVHTSPLGAPDWPPLDQVKITDAQGVMFLCPVCFVKNNGPVGTESVLCWFRDHGVPDDAKPGPGRWNATGTSFEDLTLTPSVNVDNGHWHGWVTNGEVK